MKKLFLLVIPLCFMLTACDGLTTATTAARKALDTADEVNEKAGEINEKIKNNEQLKDAVTGYFNN